MRNFWSGATSANRVFGPYVFDGTVNCTNYLKMLKSFFWPKVSRTRDYQKCFFFRKIKRVNADKAALVQTLLTERFGEKIIDKNEWAPQSPDFNPCDYFLRGYLKQRVYNPLPKTLLISAGGGYIE
jgi:hypothetical protein